MENVEFVKGVKHTAHGLNFYLSYFDDIARLLPREDYCFVVGGWVRDRLLGEPIGYSVDVDLLVTCSPTKIAKEFAQLIGGSYFEFEKKGLLRRPTVATVVLRLGPYRYRFDFSQIKGRDVEKALIEDLKSRDFTANAMAVSIDDILSIGAKQTIIYDPTGGVEDLEKGILRPVSTQNLEEDPVRILRGFRLAVEKDLQLTEDFYQFVKKKAHLLAKAPAERISLELLKILRSERSARVIRDLYEHGILEVIVPEVARLREIKDQGQHHIYPLDEHTLKVLEHLEEVLKEKEKYLHAELLKDLGSMHVHGDFSDVELLKLASLLHDIAKPHTFAIKDGKVTFYNHDKLGSQIALEVCRRLRLGEQAAKFVAKIVEHHLRPFYLRESLEKGQLTRKGLARFWVDCEDVAPHLFLHAIADGLASGDSQEEMLNLLKTIEELTHFKLSMNSQTKLEPLLNGKEIMEIFKVPQGPIVGKLKNLLLEAQMEGKVKTKEEAIEFLRSYLSNSNLTGEPSGNLSS